MRKYTGLMAVVIVILAAGLILTMGAGDPNTGGRGKGTQAYGQDIDAVKYRELGVSTLRVINQSTDPANPYAKFFSPNALIEYAKQLGAQNYFYSDSLSDRELRSFVGGRLIVQNEAANLGIYPSREEAIKFIQTQLFVDADGNFDSPRYNDFIESIGSNGYQQETFVELVGEVLVNYKLQQVVAGGVQASTFVADKTVLFLNQTMTASTIQIDLDTYKKDFTPTEEEIKTFWSENEGKYLSDRQLKISYVYEKPVYDKTAPTKPVRTPETTDEEYAKLDTQFAKDLAAWEIYKKRTDNALASKFDEFTVKIDTDENQQFKKILTKAGLTVTTTELFNKDTVPAELKDVKTKDGTPLAEALLARPFGKTAEYQLQAPIKTSDEGWIYVNFEEEKVSEPKTYEAAKEAATADLITKLANEKLTESVKEIKTKIIAANKTGKSLEDAAKELNLTVNKVENVKPPVRPSRNNRQPTAPPLHDAIYRLAAATDENSFTENNWVTPTNVTLVFLEKRVVEKTAQFIQAQANATANSSRNVQLALYRSWMSNAISNANIPEPTN